MFKKLITLVQALILVSVFSMGFATWTIATPTVETTVTGGLQADDVGSDVTIGLTDIGVVTENIKNPTGFTYALSGGVASFSKTTLTVDVGFFGSSLENLTFDDMLRYYFSVELTANNAAALNYLQSATFALQNVPSLNFNVELDGYAAKFPLKSSTQASIYNIVSRTPNYSNSTVNTVITFNFDFSSVTDSATVRSFCTSTYTFNFSVMGK